MNRSYITTLSLIILTFAVNGVINAAATASSSSSSAVAVASPVVVPSVPTAIKKSVVDMSIPELLDDLTQDVSKLLILYWEYKAVKDNNKGDKESNALLEERFDRFKKYLATVTDITAEIEKTADDKGITLVTMAMEDGRSEIIELLREKGLIIDATREFINSVMGNKKGVVEYLMCSGADINAVFATLSGNTALMLAARQGHLEIVKLLVEAGAHVNDADDGGWTALMKAGFYGHLDIVGYLIEKGADINAVNSFGETALIKAIWKGNLAIAKLLIQSRADINVADDRGSTALMEASIGGYFEIAQCLIEKGANVNAVDKRGYTPLMKAVFSGCLEMVKCLVENGANIEAISKFNDTALGIAVISSAEQRILGGRDYIGIISFLKTEKARKEALKKFRWSPSYALHIIQSNL